MSAEASASASVSLSSPGAGAARLSVGTAACAGLGPAASVPENAASRVAARAPPPNPPAAEMTPAIRCGGATNVLATGSVST